VVLVDYIGQHREEFRVERIHHPGKAAHADRP
jgi:hypothetical protein